MGLPFCKGLSISCFSCLGNLQARLAFSTWPHRSGLGPPARAGDEPAPHLLPSLSPGPLQQLIHETIAGRGRAQEGRSPPAPCRWGEHPWKGVAAPRPLAAAMGQSTPCSGGAMPPAGRLGRSRCHPCCAICSVLGSQREPAQGFGDRKRAEALGTPCARGRAALRMLGGSCSCPGSVPECPWVSLDPQRQHVWVRGRRGLSEPCEAQGLDEGLSPGPRQNKETLSPLEARLETPFAFP